MSLNELIEMSNIYTTKPDFVKELANMIIENRKIEEQWAVEIKKIKLKRLQNELELAKIWNETKTDFSKNEIKTESSSNYQAHKNLNGTGANSSRRMEFGL